MLTRSSFFFARMLAADVKAHGPPPSLTGNRPDLDTSRAPYCCSGAEDEIRTRDPLLGKEVLYH